MNPELFDFYEQDAVTEAEKLVADGRIFRFRQERTDDGRIRLSGRYADHFNFVDRAQVIVSADGSCVDSSRCDCAGSRSTTSFCCHCAALLLLLEEQEEPAPAVSAAVSFRAYTPAGQSEPETEPAPEEAESAPADAAPMLESAGDPAPAIGDLSYSFVNCQADLYPGDPDPEIPRERFELVFGRNMMAKRLYKKYGRWQGSCYGMVSSSSMFYHPGNNVSVPDFRRSASVPAQLRLSDRNRGLDLTLHSFIEAMHISQMGTAVGLCRNSNLSRSLSERLETLVEKVRSFEATGTAPVMMEVYQNERYQGGHAVLPFRYEKLDRLRSRLHIYDPNIPHLVRFCELRQDRAGNYQSWRFLMADNTEYSSDTGGVISYLAHEVYQGAWDRRGGEPTAALFSTNNEDLSLQDEAGTEVLKISGGKMQSLREDVIPVRVTDGEGSGYARECWVSPGTYRVINEDPDCALCFAFTGEKGEIEVETEAEEAFVTIDDEEEVQKVEFREKCKAFLVRIATFAKEVLLKGTSSALGTIIESLLLNFLRLRGLVLDDVDSFQIDGEDADVTGYLEELEAELEEEPEEEDEELLIANSAAPAPDAPEADDPGEAET